MVVAKSESLDEQTRAEVAGTAVARLGVPEEDVVFTGLDDRDEWLPRLRDRLGALTANDSTRLNQLTALADSLDALGDVEHGIADEIDAQQLKAELIPGPWDELIAAYDQEARKAVANFEKALADPLGRHTKSATERALQYSEKSRGWPHQLGQELLHQRIPPRRPPRARHAGRLVSQSRPTRSLRRPPEARPPSACPC